MHVARSSFHILLWETSNTYTYIHLLHTLDSNSADSTVRTLCTVHKGTGAISRSSLPFVDRKPENSPGPNSTKMSDSFQFNSPFISIKKCATTRTESNSRDEFVRHGLTNTDLEHFKKHRCRCSSYRIYRQVLSRTSLVLGCASALLSRGVNLRPIKRSLERSLGRTGRRIIR